LCSAGRKTGTPTKFAEYIPTADSLLNSEKENLYKPSPAKVFLRNSKTERTPLLRNSKLPFLKKPCHNAASLLNSNPESDPSRARTKRFCLTAIINLPASTHLPGLEAAKFQACAALDDGSFPRSAARRASGCGQRGRSAGLEISGFEKFTCFLLL